jgi:membrane-associated protease RseP (regulator of RpoE activity)
MSSNGYPPPTPSGPPFLRGPEDMDQTPPFISLSSEQFRNTFDADEFGQTWRRPRHRYWLHLLLLLLTLVTTTVVGAGLAHSFAANQPFGFDFDFTGYVRIFRDPAFALSGLPFSLTLLTILMAHEMGHYLAARYYRVDATLPFFIPAPTLIGTMGAFIRLRSPLLSKRMLFDIGIAGPIAGFIMLIVPLMIGMSLSKVVPGIAVSGDLIFGNPLLLRLVESVWFPGVAAGDISLHPMVRGVWAGLLATALNLLPIGQLDGGHVLYAFVGERAKWLSRFFVLILIPLGIFFAYSWLVWAVVLFFLGMRHPSIYDPRPLGRNRQWLGFAALLIFLVSFTPTPVKAGLGL